MKKNCKRIKGLILCSIIFWIVGTACAQNYTITINTVASTPVNPYIQDALGKAAKGISVSIRHTSASSDTIKLLGKLERISPSPFSVNFKISNYNNLPYMYPGPFEIKFCSAMDLNSAFGNFKVGDLDINGTTINDIMDGNKIKLPQGQYRICFYAVKASTQVLTYLSNPNLGCATFNVCKVDPPQFTYPASNLTISSNIVMVQSTSPVNFAWTPPISNCGSQGVINYELEIREILNNQTVTDAINNPFVFRKTAIPSTTFLLDLNSYQNVLQHGKKYAIRVRATSVGVASPIVIDNNGYSRVEAFQFGSIKETNIQPLLIPLSERKSNFWDDYESKRDRDTLVPIAEYIAYKLMQQGIAYNLDAIEYLLSLNPELKDMSSVRLYQPLKLPVFPEVPSSLLRNFELTHANSLKPDNEEVALFMRKLDSLKKINKTPEMFVKELTDLRNHLDKFSSQASLLNSVSLSFINSMLSELMFNLRRSQDGMTNSEYNHLRNISSDLKAISVIPSSTSLLNTDSYSESLSYNFSAAPIPGIYRLLASFPYHSKTVIKEKYFENFYAVTDQLIPLNVIVYRPAQPPAKPISNAPDLKGVYRIFYTPRNLYNNRNPEINAKSPGLLASTTQVSLPRKLEYKFWTLNMLNHKQTLAQDVDIDELFQKKDIKGKRLTIVLKVE